MCKELFTDLCARPWAILTDPENNGIQRRLFDSVPEDAVPCRIPSMIQQYFPDYHGVVFYWCVLEDMPDPGDDGIVFLRFDGADYKADVWLDGKKLGSHEGAEAPFCFDVTDFCDGARHLLCVRVVNPAEKDIDGLNLRNIPSRNKSLTHNAGSGFNCGGLWYGVKLVRLPKAYIEDCLLKGDIHTGRLSADVTLRLPRTCEITLTLRVFERTGEGSQAAEASVTLTADAGQKDVTLCADIKNAKLWSCEDPNLYRVVLSAESPFGSHTVVRSFGLREFRVENGYFTLNGKRLFLKCSHTGNNFPVGMMMPTSPELLRADMLFAKSNGFNAIRSIAGVLRPEQLDVCDEIGLMVYEECYAAWDVGYMCNAPIGDEAAMLQRYRSCTLDMIRRDKNHPCITVWGLLNECPDDVIFNEAVRFLPEVVKADGTRFIMLNAGRFDNRLSIGSCANPGSTEWENLLGMDGVNTDGQTWRSDDTIGGSLNNAGDYHMYPNVPMMPSYVDRIRRLGYSVNPVFYSETGIGSLFNVMEEARMFAQHGEDEKLEDYAWLREQSESFVRDFNRFGLDSTFPFPEALLKESQRLHCAERTELFNLIRSNPRINGYSLTGFLDHGMCGEGLISYWRRPKPEIFDTLIDGWSPLRFCLFSRRNLFAGEKFAFEAVLASENALPSGSYTAHFAVTDADNRTLWRTSADFVIPEDRPFAVPVLKTEADVVLESGEYTLVAEMENAAPMGRTRHFTVTDTRVQANKRAYALGVNDDFRTFAAAHAVDVLPYEGGPASSIIIGESLREEDVKALREAAENGTNVLFMSCKPFAEHPEFLRALGPDGVRAVTDLPDWLYHKECVVTPHPAFDGFKKGLASFPFFNYCFPTAMYESERVPDEVISPAFHTGYYAIKGGYGAFHALCAFNVGKGKLLLNTYRVLETLSEEPAAAKLMLNLINYIAK